MNLQATTYEADVGIIELAQTIRFDKFKQPAALARPGMLLDKGLRLNVTGWGTTRESGEFSPKLMQVRVPYVPFKECKDAYADLPIPHKVSH